MSAGETATEERVRLEMIREHAPIRLTPRGGEQLTALIETEEQPSEVLLRAAERNPDVRPVAVTSPDRKPC